MSHAHRHHPVAVLRRYLSLPVVGLAVIVVLAALKTVWP
jgi:hypothetical protein